MPATRPNPRTPQSPPIQLPSQNELIAIVRDLARREEAVARALEAIESGTFRHPDGRTDDLGLVRITPAQAGLLAWLARDCATGLSIEVGFGMGSSAAVILGARRLAGKPFAHLIFDPFGLPSGRGEVTQEYLQARFPKGFRRVMKPSEIGLAELIDRNGPGAAGLIFIDGGHRFENVMIDFVLADQLCCLGGYIVLDDACFPAIESVVNYIVANRPDYAVAHLALPNCTLVRKIAPDRRAWDAFTPFEVPNRHNWTASSSG